MKIEILTSTMVPPISKTPQEVIWNANVDLVVPRIHVASIYFYRPNGSPDFFSGDIIREAIGKTLVPFYPMGGRLQRDANGRVEINCRGQGVLFVEAEADAVIDDFGNFAPHPRLQKLVPKVEPTEDISSYPLLVLQVTRFMCGGVSFGVGMQHHVADGMSGIQFINTISDFARGAPVTVTPWMDRTLLRARDPPVPAFPHVEYLPAPPLLSSLKEDESGKLAKGHSDHAPAHVTNGGVLNSNGHVNGTPIRQRSGLAAVPNGLSSAKENAPTVSPAKVLAEAVNGGGTEHVAIEPPMAVAVFVLSKEKLSVLKKKAMHEHNKVAYSTYEMLSGHIWKCITKARGLDGQQPTKLYIATDGRNRLVPRLPKDYFGNVIFTSTPISTAGEIVSQPLYYGAGKIHDALARMDNEYLRSALDFLQLQPDPSKLVRGAHTFRAPNLGITSWARLPLYDCDFGWGRPIFMGPACIAYDGLAYVLPSPVNDGSLTISLGLRSDYMSKFGELIMNVEDAE